MLSNLVTKLALWALTSKKITGDNKTKVLNALLDNIGALPFRKIITFDQYGTLMVNGKYLEVEQAIAFKQGAMALRDNFVRKLLNDQKKWLAIEHGIHNGLTPESIVFSKACLYDIGQEDTLLAEIIGE